MCSGSEVGSYSTEICSVSEAGSYFELMFSTPGSRVIRKKKKKEKVIGLQVGLGAILVREQLPY
jgi:hypothetical protein